MLVYETSRRQQEPAGAEEVVAVSETEGSKRYRFSVPGADDSSQRWLDEQQNLSLSLRYLVRAHIAREGYGDVFCKPVEQLPRRGRPPGLAREAEAEDEVLEQQPARLARPAQPQAEPERVQEPVPAPARPARPAPSMDIGNLLDQAEETE